MKKTKILAAAACAALLAFGLFGCGGNDAKSESKSDAKSDAPAVQTENLRFVTGGESGTYYAYGNVLGQYATNGDYNVNVSALSGNGSQANIQALEDGDADIAFCQSDVLAYAYEGTNLFDGAPYKDFSIVADLYQEQVQIVTCDPSIKTVADLAGKTVSVGAAGSGVYFNALDVLGVYDLTLDDINPVYQSFADSADSLKDNKIDAAFIVAGAPTTAITDLSTTKTAYLVSMDDAHVDELMAISPYYSKAVIPADTYGLEGPVTTVSVGAVVIANNSVSEDAIYNFTKSLFDGQENNADAHAKYKELVIEDAAAITSVPYHPGAAKYYEEQEIEVGK
ncbi:TAXI family TRAP transporter solute-binding subunit [Adlercreutzia faecimuris]|uniref:TAXI family TRAP transporter solute-binding subunit n=1 Tax=Adlercreutzia faecimuris TaxID=2897341 RepID=A0ABS9WEI2_9ACTN|nr:TAXI family TRAP transporter solute-binding subunit [Adlercreutzia sp. JBNU-10]MCI2241224.1 TAXI family TRAP transporter solute-binding subunit [Adlercreutzia sp. JBNU-10]